MATAKNDVTGDFIKSKPASDMFDKNFDKIDFSVKLDTPINKEWDELKPVGKEVLPEYELNKSTGEVEKVEGK